jgi:hypothetical protein
VIQADYKIQSAQRNQEGVGMTIITRLREAARR